MASHSKKGASLKAILCFLDESGFSKRPTVRKTWGIRGKTPIIRSTGSWKNISATGIVATDPKLKSEWIADEMTWNIIAKFMVSPEIISLGIKIFKVDSRPVVVPATKGRILRHRPRIDNWEIAFTLEYDNILLNEPQVRKIVDDMGSRVGLLDFRPEKKGMFGRCIVTEWISNNKD